MKAAPGSGRVHMLAVEIIVIGRIDKEWCEWLGGLMLTHSEQDQTVLTGILPDQAAVYGVISRLRDLGIPLSSVCIEAIETNKGETTNKHEEQNDGNTANLQNAG